jgi:hypothetical protein
MEEYLFSTKSYKKLLLSDTNTSTDFIPKYISGINHPEFSRYLLSENRKYTTEESYLYKILEGEEIDIDWAVYYGDLEVIKYLYSKGLEVTEDGINGAARNGRVTSKTT